MTQLAKKCRNLSDEQIQSIKSPILKSIIKEIKDENTNKVSNYTKTFTEKHSKTYGKCTVGFAMRK